VEGIGGEDVGSFNRGGQNHLWGGCGCYSINHISWLGKEEGREGKRGSEKIT